MDIKFSPINDFRLIFKPTSNRNGIEITGYLPSAIVKGHYGFEGIYLSFQKQGRKFEVHQDRIPEVSIVLSGVLELDPNIVLGNLIEVDIVALGKRYPQGDCSIVLGDPTRDEVQERIDAYESQKA